MPDFDLAVIGAGAAGLSVTAVAAQLGIRVAKFGMTYPQWRTSTRVFQAMIQLAEGATVTETAHRCGWATTSAFVDTFARTMGQTPGAYRAAAT